MGTDITGQSRYLGLPPYYYYKCLKRLKYKTLKISKSVNQIQMKMNFVQNVTIMLGKRVRLLKIISKFYISNCGDICFECVEGIGWTIMRWGSCWTWNWIRIIVFSAYFLSFYHTNHLTTHLIFIWINSWSEFWSSLCIRKWIKIFSSIEWRRLNAEKFQNFRWW